MRQSFWTKNQKKWRNRPIDRKKYLQLDARYEKVRPDGMVLSCAVLIATGVMIWSSKNGHFS